MRASFVVGFHTQRLDNLLQTLRFLEKWHRDVVSECELVLVCQDEFREAHLYTSEWEEVWANLQIFSMDLPCMRLPYVTNFGVNAANCDKLIILESDRILPEGYFASVIDQLEEGLQITTKMMIRPTKELTDQEISENDFEHTEELRNKYAEPGKRNMWSGNTALMKSDYEKAGQMDEFYEGYGWADCDMTLTMEKAGIESVYRDETEIHLWHPSMTYGDGDQKQMYINNGVYFCSKWGQPHPLFLREDLAAQRTGLV